MCCFGFDVRRSASGSLRASQEVFQFTPKSVVMSFNGSPSLWGLTFLYISSRWCSSRCCGSSARHVERHVKQMPTDTRRHKPRAHQRDPIAFVGGGWRLTVKLRSPSGTELSSASRHGLILGFFYLITLPLMWKSFLLRLSKVRYTRLLFWLFKRRNVVQSYILYIVTHSLACFVSVFC